MEAKKYMASFLDPNFQLDRFDGTNFTHWKGKFFFLLIVLNIAYVLHSILQPLPKLDDVNNIDESKVEMKKKKKIRKLKCFVVTEVENNLDMILSL